MVMKDDIGYKSKICCSIKNKKRLMEECMDEFLKHHPEIKGLRLTENFMLEKVIDFYLEQD